MGAYLHISTMEICETLFGTIRLSQREKKHVSKCPTVKKKKIDDDDE